MINSKDTEKVSDVIQHLFMKLSPNKLGTDGMYFNIIKAIQA